MWTPRLSVIVSVYDQERYLPTLLSSLARQDVPVPYEVIVCDDGSSSRTADQVRRARLDIRHVWQPHDGFRVARSRNNGIRCAQGEVLVFVDGDSVLRPFLLRDHWEAHQGEASLVCGSCQNVAAPPDDLPADAAAYLGTVPDATTDTDRGDRVAWIGSTRPWMACSSGHMSLPRTPTVFFDERFQGWGSEDRDFAYRAYTAGLRVVLLERVGLVHLWQLGRAIAWNPGKGGDPESIVAALTSKLLLYRKYPGDLMAPSLDLVRYCWYDSRSDAWRVGAAPHSISTPDVLRQFETWLESRAARQGRFE